MKFKLQCAPFSLPNVPVAASHAFVSADASLSKKMSSVTMFVWAPSARANSEKGPSSFCRIRHGKCLNQLRLVAMLRFMLASLPVIGKMLPIHLSSTQHLGPEPDSTTFQVCQHSEDVKKVALDTLKLKGKADQLTVPQCVSEWAALVAVRNGCVTWPPWAKSWRWEMSLCWRARDPVVLCRTWSAAMQ